MESTDATTTNASAVTDGIQHNTATYDEIAGDQTQMMQIQQQPQMGMHVM